MQTVVEEKFGLGFGFTITVSEVLEVHPPGVAVTFCVTLYVPDAVYVCEGLCSVEVFPSPKFQLQLFPPPVERSVNCVAVPKQIVVALKAAAGCGLTVITKGKVELQVPVEDTVNVTV